MRSSAPLLPPPGGRGGAGMTRRIAAYLAMSAVCAALLVVATQSLQQARPVKLAEMGGGKNEKFLHAAGGGEGGAGFVKRLEDMWFVEEHSGRADLAEDATELSSAMQIAGLPEDMHACVDEKVNPCDDFYEFACGKWDHENRHAIPSYKSQVAFAWDRAEKAIRHKETAVLEEDEGPAGTYYKACMDLDHIEEVGDKPLQPWLKYVDAISDKASLVTAITEFNKHNMDNFFSWWIDTDPRDTTRKVFTVAQGGFTLPEKTYYLEDSPVMQKHRDTLVEISSRFFQLAGYPKEVSDKRAKLILDFETKLATITIGKEEARKDHGAPVEWNEFSELMPYWPWQEWLQHLGSCTSPPDGSAKVCSEDHAKVWAVGEPGKTPLYMMNKPFFPKLNSLLEETDMETFKAVLGWKVIRNAALYMSNKYIELMVEFNADLYGVSQKNPRARKCYYSVQSGTPWPMAKLYVDKIFHHANREAAVEMLGNVRARFDAALADEEWMTVEDRTAAQEKLRQMFFQVAYPTDKDDKPAWPRETTDLDGLIGVCLCVCESSGLARLLHIAVSEGGRR